MKLPGSVRRLLGALVSLMSTVPAPVAIAETLLDLNAGDFSVPVGSVTQGTWKTSLLARDWSGNGSGIDAYYDPFLDLTWLADPDYAKTSGFDSDGLITLADARAWVGGLTLFGGDDWRLPVMRPVSGLPLFNNTFSNNGTTDHGTARTGVGWGAASELGYMYYVHLGNKGIFTPNDTNPTATSPTQPGFGLTNKGPFTNLRPEVYTTGIEVGSIGSVNFGFQNGFQSSNGRPDNPTRVWAVHSGDVLGPLALPAPVPLPGSPLLFGSALAALVGFRRRWRQADARLPSGDQVKPLPM